MSMSPRSVVRSRSSSRPCCSPGVCPAAASPAPSFHPGVAAQVGDDTISVREVDSIASELLLLDREAARRPTTRSSRSTTCAAAIVGQLTLVSAARQLAARVRRRARGRVHPQGLRPARRRRRRCPRSRRRRGRDRVVLGVPPGRADAVGRRRWQERGSTASGTDAAGDGRPAGASRAGSTTTTSRIDPQFGVGIRGRQGRSRRRLAVLRRRRRGQQGAGRPARPAVRRVAAGRRPLRLSDGRRRSHAARGAAGRLRRRHAAAARRVRLEARADPPVAGALPARGDPRDARGPRRAGTSEPGAATTPRTCARSSATCCCRCTSTPRSPRSAATSPSTTSPAGSPRRCAGATRTSSAPTASARSTGTPRPSTTPGRRSRPPSGRARR